MKSWSLRLLLFLHRRVSLWKRILSQREKQRKSGKSEKTVYIIKKITGPDLLVNHKFSTLSTGFSTAGSEKNLEKWGFFLRLQKNSTAEGNRCGD